MPTKDIVERLKTIEGLALRSPEAMRLMADAADEIERLRDLLNKTAANNRTKAREIRRLTKFDHDK